MRTSSGAIRWSAAGIGAPAKRTARCASPPCVAKVGGGGLRHDPRQLHQQASALTSNATVQQSPVGQASRCSLLTANTAPANTATSLGPHLGTLALFSRRCRPATACIERRRSRCQQLLLLPELIHRALELPLQQATGGRRGYIRGNAQLTGGNTTEPRAGTGRHKLPDPPLSQGDPHKRTLP